MSAGQVETSVRLRQVAKLFGVSTSGGWREYKAVSTYSAGLPAFVRSVGWTILR